MPPYTSGFNHFPSEATPEGGTYANDAIERERRMNNWIRSYSLPQELGNDVQDQMIRNPYDRNADLRAELIQQDVQSNVFTPWRAKELMAQQMFRESNVDPSAATSSPGQSPRHKPSASPQAATQSAGPVALRGSFAGGSEFGPSTMIPTAGNYMNGAYSGQMQSLGLGDNPAVAAYTQAVKDYRTPDQRHAIELAQVQGGAQLAAAMARGPVGDAPKDPLDAAKKKYGKDLENDQKQEVANSEEFYQGYQRYLSGLKGEPGMSFDDWSTQDPVARAIAEKQQASSALSGKGRRDGTMAKEAVMRGDVGPNTAGERVMQKLEGGQQAGAQPTQRPQTADIRSQVTAAMDKGATPEQLRKFASQAKLSLAERQEVEQAISLAEAARKAKEAQLIRQAQFGPPAGSGRPAPTGTAPGFAPGTSGAIVSKFS